MVRCSTAGGTRRDLRSGQANVSAAEGSPGDPPDALGNPCAASDSATRARPERTAEHGVRGTGEPDDPAGRRSIGTANLGDRAGSTIAAGPSGMVARLLPLCAAPYILAHAPCPTARAGRAARAAALPAADASDGGRTDQSALDRARPSADPTATSSGEPWLRWAGWSRLGFSFARKVGGQAHKAHLTALLRVRQPETGHKVGQEALAELSTTVRWSTAVGAPSIHSV